MNGRGNTTPVRHAIAIVMTTGSAMRPRNALGNPSSEACHDRPTVEHEMCLLKLHDSSAAGFLARAIASIESTSEAVSDRIDEMSISTNAGRWSTGLRR